MGKHGMNMAFLSLGGNLGNRMETLQAARKELNGSNCSIINISSVYETEAWGSASQKKYLNQVVEIRTRLDCEELMEVLLQIEKKYGRIREAKYGDRTLDLDILLYNNAVVNTNLVNVPHPRLHLRKFILIPLNEITPSLIHPVFNKTIGDLLMHCNDTLAVQLFDENRAP